MGEKPTGAAQEPEEGEQAAAMKSQPTKEAGSEVAAPGRTEGSINTTRSNIKS